MRQTELSRRDRERVAALKALRALALEDRRKPRGDARRPRWWRPLAGR
jgi:hypothetical protein